MDSRRFKPIVIKITAVCLAISMFASCATKTPSVTKDSLEHIPAELQQAEVPETLGGEKPVVSEASDDVWNEIQRKAQEAEEAKRKIAEAFAEAERLEAERLEAERLEAERIEAERLEAERLAEEQRLAEEARIRAEEDALAAHEIDVEPEIIEEESDPWKIAGEDESVSIVSDTTDESYGIRDTSSDRILEGDPKSTDMPSWLLSPTEQNTDVTSAPEVVNIYHPIQEEQYTEVVTADDILALGSKYEATRESKLSVKEMNREQLVSKILDIVEMTGPYILMALCALFIILILRFLVKKVMNPKRKKKTESEEGVEVVADGYMVSRPGAEEEPEGYKEDAVLPDDEFHPEKVDSPDYDPRSKESDESIDVSDVFKDAPPWQPAKKTDGSDDDSYGQDLLPD